MAGLAASNLALASHGDVRLWAAFLAIAPITLKLALGVIQYGLTRRQVITALRREGMLRTPVCDGFEADRPLVTG